jgi:hypothetical protein
MPAVMQQVVRAIMKVIESGLIFGEMMTQK